MAKLLNSFRDIATVPDNYSYTSPVKKATYWWTLLFGSLTGDMNKVHVDPMKACDYNSRLGGLARHGISTIAQAESFIFKIFEFDEPTETLAKGYDKIRYLRPVNIGDQVMYTYTLQNKKVSEEKKWAQCAWQVKGINQRNEEVFVATWIVLYCFVEKIEQQVSINLLPLTGSVMTGKMTKSEYRSFMIGQGAVIAFFILLLVLLHFTGVFPMT